MDISSVTPIEPVDTAPDVAAPPAGARGDKPSYEEIAEAAYRRYVQRGGSDGRDFDDWLEAERELTNRNTR